MAKYLPHNIYTTIAEFSEELAAPIRHFLVMHTQKGSSIEVIASRIDIKTKDGNELLIPLPAPIAHLMNNKYNEEIVLTYARQLGETIETFAAGDTSDAEQALFLKMRNTLKNVKTLNERQILFFQLYERGVITSPALIKSIGTMVAIGIPSQHPYTPEVDYYGELLFKLAEDGKTVWTPLGELLKAYHAPATLGWYMGEELELWRKVAIAGKKVDNICVNEQLHFCTLLGVQHVAFDEDVLPFNHPATYALINGIYRTTSSIKPPFNYAKTYFLRNLMHSKKGISTMLLDAEANPEFQNFQQFTDSIVRTLRSMLLSLWDSKDVFPAKVMQSKTSAHCNALSDMVAILGNRQLEYLKLRIVKHKDPIIFSFSTLIAHPSQTFDYLIIGTDSQGQQHTFRPSVYGMPEFVWMHQQLRDTMRLGKTILRTKDNHEGIGSYGATVDVATRDISWITYNLNGDKDLETVYLREQFHLAKTFTFYRTDVYGTNVCNTTAYRQQVFKLLGSQGVNIPESMASTLLDFSGKLNLNDSPMSQVAKTGMFSLPKGAGKSMDTFETTVDVSTVGQFDEMNPSSIKLPYAVEPALLHSGFDIGQEPSFSKMFPVVTKAKKGVPSPKPIPDIVPEPIAQSETESVGSNVVPMSIPSINLNIVPAKFDFICGGKKGTEVTLTPDLLDIIYGGSTSAGGYVCSMQVGVAYLGARYTPAAQRLSLRWYGVIDQTELGVKVANLGFVKKSGGYHSLHIAVTTQETAKELLNLIIQRFNSIPLIKNAILYI